MGQVKNSGQEFQRGGVGFLKRLQEFSETLPNAWAHPPLPHGPIRPVASFPHGPILQSSWAMAPSKHVFIGPWSHSPMAAFPYGPMPHWAAMGRSSHAAMRHGPIFTWGPVVTAPWPHLPMGGPWAHLAHPSGASFPHGPIPPGPHPPMAPFLHASSPPWAHGPSPPRTSPPVAP